MVIVEKVCEPVSVEQLSNLFFSYEEEEWTQASRSLGGGWDPTASVVLLAERICIAVCFNNPNLFTVFIFVYIHVYLGAWMCRCMNV